VGTEESSGLEVLTGVAGIDRAQDLSVTILDARGTGRLGGTPLAAGKQTPVTPGVWMLTDQGSSYEITLRSSLLPDGIVRLEGRSAFLVERDSKRTLPAFRLFGGQASFYLPHLPPGELTVLTPAGPLVTRGAIFTVTVAPDFQVLITCREGAVYLTGNQNAVALPGQVVVADRLGRGRVYAMTPSAAATFSGRWLSIMTEEAPEVVDANLNRRLAAWQALKAGRDLEGARFLALWFREAGAVHPNGVPGPDTWSWALAVPVHPSAWIDPPPAPGLLGELP